MARIGFYSVLLAIFLIAPQWAFAQKIAFRVLGVQGRVLFEAHTEISPGYLGEGSHRLLESALGREWLHQYDGSAAGVKAINELGSALEVLSDTQMNAYGWCYRVDGEISDLLADQYPLTGNERQIEWFYAYAHFEKNNWTAMCVPADHKPVHE